MRAVACPGGREGCPRLRDPDDLSRTSGVRRDLSLSLSLSPSLCLSPSPSPSPYPSPYPSPIALRRCPSQCCKEQQMPVYKRRRANDRQCNDKTRTNQDRCRTDTRNKLGSIILGRLLVLIPKGRTSSASRGNAVLSQIALVRLDESHSAGLLESPGYEPRLQASEVHR